MNMAGAAIIPGGVDGIGRVVRLGIIASGDIVRPL